MEDKGMKKLNIERNVSKDSSLWSEFCLQIGRLLIASVIIASILIVLPYIADFGNTLLASAIENSAWLIAMGVGIALLLAMLSRVSKKRKTYDRVNYRPRVMDNPNFGEPNRPRYVRNSSLDFENHTICRNEVVGGTDNCNNKPKIVEFK